MFPLLCSDIQHFHKTHLFPLHFWCMIETPKKPGILISSKGNKTKSSSRNILDKLKVTFKDENDSRKPDKPFQNLSIIDEERDANSATITTPLSPAQIKCTSESSLHKSTVDSTGDESSSISNRSRKLLRLSRTYSVKRQSVHDSDIGSKKSSNDVTTGVPAVIDNCNVECNPKLKKQRVQDSDLGSKNFQKRQNLKFRL